MKEYRSVCLECVEGKALEFNFLKNGGVKVEYGDHSLEILESEWNQFKDYISSIIDDKPDSRKCGKCGKEGHNARTCLEERLRDLSTPTEK